MGIGLAAENAASRSQAFMLAFIHKDPLIPAVGKAFPKSWLDLLPRQDRGRASPSKVNSVQSDYLAGFV